MRAVLRHQILEGPAVVEAGKLIVGHVDLEGVPSWTAVTDAQSRRAGSPLREQLHRERADRLEAALEEEERSKVRGALGAQRSKVSGRGGVEDGPTRALPLGHTFALSSSRCFVRPQDTLNRSGGGVREC